MSNDQPTILSYATPAPVNRFARTSAVVIVLLAILLPGISSSLIRRSPWPCLILTGTVPAAFGFFGPLWGEILFKGTALRDAGLYPFLATCLLVEVASVVLAMNDRRRALERIV